MQSAPREKHVTKIGALLGVARIGIVLGKSVTSRRCVSRSHVPLTQIVQKNGLAVIVDIVFAPGVSSISTVFPDNVSVEYVPNQSHVANTPVER